jgi:hypothetical protein
MITRWDAMALSKRFASSVLLACGIVLVFVGLSAALGFTFLGVLASVAAIAALLYAGAVWFGEAPAPPAAGSGTILVFDRSLRVAAGAAPGALVLSQFPESLRPDIERRCRLALGGEPSHFACEHGGASIAFDIAPVQTTHDLVLYGVLISGSGPPVTSVSAAR